MRMGSILQLGPQYDSQFEILQSRDQTLMFLHKTNPDLSVGVLDEALPDRCFMIQITANISGGTHSGKKPKIDEARNAVVPGGRTVQLLKFFEEIQSGDDFANFALCPAFREHVRTGEGNCLLQPINRNDLLRHFNSVMGLV